MKAGGGPQYGWVSYFHAAGVDRPMVIMKNDTSVIPHQNFGASSRSGPTQTGR